MEDFHVVVFKESSYETVEDIKGKSVFVIKAETETHSGIYGIEETTKTVEDWLVIDINYFIRVNLSTLEDIVDAIGGIEVDLEYAFTLVIGGYSFSEGMNHLNGEEAFAFARERKSFSDGYLQRVKNQKKVFSNIIKKISGSTAEDKQGNVSGGRMMK